MQIRDLNIKNTLTYLLEQYCSLIRNQEDVPEKTKHFTGRVTQWKKKVRLDMLIVSHTQELF